MGQGVIIMSYLTEQLDDARVDKDLLCEEMRKAELSGNKEEYERLKSAYQRAVTKYNNLRESVFREGLSSGHVDFDPTVAYTHPHWR